MDASSTAIRPGSNFDLLLQDSNPSKMVFFNGISALLAKVVMMVNSHDNWFKETDLAERARALREWLTAWDLLTPKIFNFFSCQNKLDLFMASIKQLHAAMSFWSLGFVEGESLLKKIKTTRLSTWRILFPDVTEPPVPPPIRDPPSLVSSLFQID